MPAWPNRCAPRPPAPPRPAVPGSLADWFAGDHPQQRHRRRGAERDAAAGGVRAVLRLRADPHRGRAPRAPARARPGDRRRDDRDRALGAVGGAAGRVRAGAGGVRARRPGMLGALGCYILLQCAMYLSRRRCCCTWSRCLPAASRSAASPRRSLPAQVVAASTQSSLASLPAMIESARDAPGLSAQRDLAGAADGGVAVPHHQPDAVHRRGRVRRLGLRHRPDARRSWRPARRWRW